MAQHAGNNIGTEETCVIDRAHLSRTTFGDTGLAREVLALFDTQAALLLGRMQGSDAGTVAALAHTLKGSALGVGAMGVARAAEAVEHADTEQNAALLRLSVAVQMARTAIAALLAPSAE